VKHGGEVVDGRRRRAEPRRGRDPLADGLGGLCCDPAAIALTLAGSRRMNMSDTIIMPPRIHCPEPPNSGWLNCAMLPRPSTTDCSMQATASAPKPCRRASSSMARRPAAERFRIGFPRVSFGIYRDCRLRAPCASRDVASRRPSLGSPDPRKATVRRVHDRRHRRRLRCLGQGGSGGLDRFRPPT